MILISIGIVSLFTSSTGVEVQELLQATTQSRMSSTGVVVYGVQVAGAICRKCAELRTPRYTQKNLRIPCAIP